MDSDDRYRSVLFDLAALLLVRDPKALLHYIDRDGIEILVSTGLSRITTRDALRSIESLHYVDEILYDDDPRPEDALEIARPEDCKYSYIAERCIHEDRRPFPLELEAF